MEKKKSEEMKVLKKSPKLYKNYAPIYPRMLMHTNKDKCKSTDKHTPTLRITVIQSVRFSILQFKIKTQKIGKYSPFKGKKEIDRNCSWKRADIRYIKYIKY